MPLIGPVIKKKVEAKVLAELQKEFAAEGVANAESMKSWERQAKVASVIAEVLIEELLTNGQVAPGIPTAGSPSAQTSVAPGKIT